MGKILLLEPHRVLQQAIALALIPAHDVRVDDGAAAVALEGLDLLIVDAAALRASERLSPELLRAVESAAVPTLWIDDKESAGAPKRQKLAVVAKPIENGAFQAAVAGLLSGTPPRAPKKRPAAAEQKPSTTKSDNTEAEPIELVEIVEEESPSEKRIAVEQKPK